MVRAAAKEEEEIDIEEDAVSAAPLKLTICIYSCKMTQMIRACKSDVLISWADDQDGEKHGEHNRRIHHSAYRQG